MDPYRPNRTDLSSSPMPRDYNPASDTTEDANVIRGMDAHNPNCETFGESWDGLETHSNPRFLDNVTPDTDYDPPGVGTSV